MREIKFRAWSKLEKKIVPVSGIVWQMGAIEDLNIGGMGYGVSYHNSIEDFELMQFTGLLDRNGKEIYEGDIITDERFKWSVFYALPVEWDSDTCSFVRDKRPDDYFRLNILGSRNYEVIGNIHENPELLK